MSEARRRVSYHERGNKRQARQAYALKKSQWSEALQVEFKDYRTWRTSNFNLDRPHRLKQRKNTFEKYLINVECFFGYLVTVCEREPATLRLADLADPALVTGYVQWHIKTRDGPSRFIQKSVELFYAIARYYLRVPAEQWSKLQELRFAIKPDRAKSMSKRARWNSLSALEAVGLAEYPTEDERLSAVTGFQQSLLASRVQRSLIIRLLVRRPLRSRNIRELKLDENLYWQNGEWIIEFTGDQMKVEERGGKENIYRVKFPPDLVPLLDEWLDKWRPLFNINGLANVFMTRNSRPFTQTALNLEFKKTVYAYTSRATNIHLMRDIWATEYILKTRDAVGAAQVLGDTVETVLRSYAHLFNDIAGDLADGFLKDVLR